jgi:hypothetical protein
MTRFLGILLGLWIVLPSTQAQNLLLPTDNRALFEQPDAFFQFVDRNFEGAQTTPWEGGQFGFVRDPRRIGQSIAYARFHEGLDIKPLRRDAQGNPQDEVRCIADGLATSWCGMTGARARFILSTRICVKPTSPLGTW